MSAHDTTVGAPPKWRPITLDELDRLGLDDKNNLYWDGSPVRTEETVRLTWWLNAAAIAGGASGLVLAAIELARYFTGSPN